jgi:lipopolysaccharide transport system ATP-binding protein
MAIHLRDATLAPIQQLTVSAPDGAVIGVIGDAASGQAELLQLAAGAVTIPFTLDAADAFSKARALADIEKQRRANATVLIASHDLALIESIADEAWWLDRGTLKAKGDPREIARQYRHYVADALRANAADQPLAPSLRRGDGRAEILALETCNAQGQPAMVFASGEPMAVRVTVRFNAHVDDPVVGIMLRTRIGSEVYGTNTELERHKFGPVQAGETVTITYRFNCDLCAQEYAITAASHDPNGVWHDWVEDAVAFQVTDTRYTAGVANLRATVESART